MVITQVPIPPIPPIPSVPHTGTGLTGLIITASTFLLLPLVVTLAIRLLRRPAPPALAPQWQDPERLDRLEQAVDTIALEVERISEGQRFLTKLLTDKTGVLVATDRALEAGGDAASGGTAR